MTKPNVLLVAMMIAGLLAGGCSISGPVIDPTVCEYPPAKLPSQATVDEAGVFALVQWATSEPTTGAAQSQSRGSSADFTCGKALESDVCLDAGRSIGFRVEKNQLIAFAGSKCVPLENGRYGWIVLSETKAMRRAREEKKRQDTAVAVFCILTLGSGLVVIYLSPWIAARFLHFHPDVGYREPSN